MHTGAVRSRVAAWIVFAIVFAVTTPAMAARPAASGVRASAAALSVQVACPEFVMSGETADYTVTVRNSGDEPLFGIVVRDTLLGELGTAESLAPGAQLVFEQMRTLERPASGVCTAEARTAQQVVVAASASHAVDVAIGDSFPDYTLDKFALSSTGEPGDVIAYRIVYRNIAEDPPGVTQPTIVDDFDERWLEPVDVAGGVVADGRITWEPAPLAPGAAVRTIEYRLRIKAGAPVGARLDNTAVISAEGDAQGPTAANNSGSAAVTVVEPPAVTPTAPAASPGGGSAAQSPGGEEGEPFLPFTGPSPLVPLAALIAAVVGTVLRKAAAAA